MPGEWSPEMREAARERAAKGRRRARGEGTLYQTTVRGQTVWRASKTVTLADGTKKRVIGTSPAKELAQRNRDRKIDELRVNAGELDRSVLLSNEERATTLAEYLNVWAEKQDPNKVQANTRQRNRGLIANHINPHLGSKQLVRVTADDIGKLMDTTLPGKRNDNGTPMLGGSPLRGVFYVLKQAFEQAEADGLITQTPLRYLKAPGKPKRQHNLSGRLDDLLTIMNHLYAIQDGSYDYWVLSFYGLRQSERLGLQWDSFTNLWTDLKKPAYMSIDRQLYNDDESNVMYIKKDTKTEASKRVLPVPDALRQALIRVAVRQEEMKKSPKWKPEKKFQGMVYCTGTGNPVRSSTDNLWWRKVVEGAGLEPLRGHDMRHLTASWLAENDTPIEVVKALIGHSTEAMTSYYTHISNKRKADALTSLSAVYERRAANMRAGVQTPQVLSLVKPAVVKTLPAEKNTLANNRKVVEQVERNKQEK